MEMTEKYYAAHIKTSPDAAAINVVRPKKNREGKKGSRALSFTTPPDDSGADV